MDVSDAAHVLPSCSATLGKDARVPSASKRARTTENTAALMGAIQRSFHFHISSWGITSARAAVVSWQLLMMGCSASSKAGTEETLRKPYLGVDDAPLTV